MIHVDEGRNVRGRYARFNISGFRVADVEQRIINEQWDVATITMHGGTFIGDELSLVLSAMQQAFQRAAQWEGERIR